ncbi:hypothetical protein SUDANB95_01975 [Actinosynnema sp. ALI-1.44]
MALLAAACTTAEPQAATPTPPPATTTVTTSTPAPAELAPQRVRAATLPADALDRFGVPEPGTDSNGQRRRLPLPCAKPKTTGHQVFGYHVNHHREWKNRGFQFVHTVTWYQDHTGADAVTKTQDMAQSCREYVYSTRDTGDHTLNVTAPITLPTPPGVSAAYAYCEDNGTTHACWALLGHDDLTSTLTTFAATREQSLTLLTEMLPAAADLLTKA